jgi:hypothetical protein
MLPLQFNVKRVLTALNLLVLLAYVLDKYTSLHLHDISSAIDLRTALIIFILVGLLVTPTIAEVRAYKARVRKNNSGGATE